MILSLLGANNATKITIWVCFFLTQFLVENLDNPEVADLALEIYNEDEAMPEQIEKLKDLYCKFHKENEEFNDINNKYFE